MKKHIMIAAILIFTTAVGFSQGRTLNIDAMQRMERARIHQGRMNGTLTRNEVQRLHAQQRFIRRDERRAKTDGIVTAQERRRLYKEQRRASRNIRYQRHDAQSRRN